MTGLILGVLVLSSEIMEIVGDYIISVSEPKGRISYSVSEACYGLTNNYNLVWYIMKPYFQNIDFNPSYYFGLSKQGVEYFISLNNIYVLDRMN